MYKVLLEHSHIIHLQLSVLLSCCNNRAESCDRDHMVTEPKIYSLQKKFANLFCRMLPYFAFSSQDLPGPDIFLSIHHLLARFLFPSPTSKLHHSRSLFLFTAVSPMSGTVPST